MSTKDTKANQPLFSNPDFKTLLEHCFVGCVRRPFCDHSAAFLLDSCYALRNARRIASDGFKTWDVSEYVPTAQAAQNARNLRPDGFPDPVLQLLLSEEKSLSHFGRPLFAYDITDPYHKKGYVQTVFVLSKRLSPESRYVADEFVAVLDSIGAVSF